MARTTHVFLSHTKLDEDFCNRFDNICCNVGIGRFRSEFASIEDPPWRTIKQQLDESRALFLLIGKELVSRQSSPDNPGWKFTQNWISYEVGIAHQRNIDIWVVCDSVDINFPVPYFNNYVPFGLEPGTAMEYMNNVFIDYLAGHSFPTAPGTDGQTTYCPGCGIEFNLHATLRAEQAIVCPQCLKGISFPAGFV